MGSGKRGVSVVKKRIEKTSSGWKRKNRKEGRKGPRREKGKGKMRQWVGCKQGWKVVNG